MKYYLKNVTNVDTKLGVMKFFAFCDPWTIE